MQILSVDLKLQKWSCYIVKRSLSQLSHFRVQPKPENAITIAVSSRVLFTMDLEQQVFEQKGMEEYLKYQIEHETEPFAPGPAFPFVKVQIKVRKHSQYCLHSFYKTLLNYSTKYILSWFSQWTDERWHRCHNAITFQALEAVNVQLRQLYPDSDELFDVVLMTNHHANVGLRLINSINHHSKWKTGCPTSHSCPLNWRLAGLLSLIL